MKFGEKLSNFFDMPADAMGELPRVVLCADRTLHISGRHRLVLCEETKMIFATVCGRLQVMGENLSISSILPGETQISGKIDGVCYLH